MTSEEALYPFFNLRSATPGLGAASVGQEVQVPSEGRRAGGTNIVETREAARRGRGPGRPGASGADHDRASAGCGPVAGSGPDGAADRGAEDDQPAALRQPGVLRPRRLGGLARLGPPVRRAAGHLFAAGHHHPGHPPARRGHEDRRAAALRAGRLQRPAQLPRPDRAELPRPGGKARADRVLPRHVRPGTGEPEQPRQVGVPAAVRRVRPVPEGHRVGGHQGLGRRPVRELRAALQAGPGHLPRHRGHQPSVPAAAGNQSAARHGVGHREGGAPDEPVRDPPRCRTWCPCHRGGSQPVTWAGWTC